MSRSRYAKQAGFTLIEIVMTIIIFSIMSGIMGSFLFQSFKTFTIANSTNQLDTQTLLGVERIVYDLRNATSLTTIGANSLTFIDQTGTSYTYTLSGTSLQRGSYTLVDSVSNLTFTYWDSNGSVTATASAVDYVKIALTLTSNSIPVTFTTTVAMRGTNE